MKAAISTDRAAQAVGPYSQGVSVRPGTLLFTAGQIGIDPETAAIVDGGVLPQFEQAMRNLSAILEAGGADLSNVVKTTVFFADLGDFGAVNERYAAWFTEPFPARSAIEAKALPKGARIEVEAIAVRPE